MPAFADTINQLCRTGSLLSVRQIGVLLACGNDDEARLIKNIARHLKQAKPVITRAADLLVSDGYVRRTRLTTDRRLVRLDLTAAGRRLVKEWVG